MNLNRICYVFVLLTLFLTGTASAEQKNSKQTKEPLIHVIISDQIQGVMLGLNQLMMERGLTALEIMEKRVEHLRALVDATEELVVSAEQMTEAIPGIRMDEQNKVTFEALAKQLREEAETLLYLAEETDYISLEPAYQRMNDTCAACHSLFRFD